MPTGKVFEPGGNQRVLTSPGTSPIVDSMDIERITGMNEEWKRLRVLEQNIAHFSLDLIREEGIDALEEVFQQSSIDSKFAAKGAEIERLQKQVEVEKKRSKSWHDRAVGHADKLMAQRARIRDLEESRKNWKEKARTTKQKLDELQQKRTRKKQ